MKKLLATILALVMALSLLPTAVWAATTTTEADAVAKVTGTAEGSATTTYYTDLHEALVYAKTNDTVTLLKDVTLTDTWTPITYFDGTLNGDSHAIKGLKVTATNTYTNTYNTGKKDNNKKDITCTGAGLFVYLNGKVENLTIDGAVINVPDATGYVGVLAGHAWNVTLNNVTVKNAAVSAKTAQYVGGLFGNGWGKITGCEVSNSTIVGKDQVGGLVGFLWIGTIENCKSLNNKMTAKEERAGGIAGKLESNSGNDTTTGIQVKSCTVSGGSATAPDLVGGIAAQFMGNQGVYSITGNTVENFVLNAGAADQYQVNGKDPIQMSALATIRSGQNEAFMNALSTNVTNNTLETITTTWDKVYENGNWLIYQKAEKNINESAGSVTNKTTDSDGSTTETKIDIATGVTTETATSKDFEHGNGTKTVVITNENNAVTQETTTIATTTDTNGTKTVKETVETKTGDTVTKTVVTETVEDAIAETKVTTTGENGEAATSAAVEVSKVEETVENKNVTLEVKAAESTDKSKLTEVTVEVPKAAATNLAKAKSVEVVTDVGTLTIDSTALKTITESVKETSDTLTLVVTKTGEGTSTTQTAAQTTTTTTTTYELTAKVNDVPVFKEVNKDKNGTITVTVPWETAPGFRQQIVCYYVDTENGNTRTRMGGTGYKDKTFSWDTNHFSKFEVVTETVSTNRAYINISGSSAATTATTTTSTTGKANSATTFDAGVGVYAATAILSVTGMAWVGKKKH